MSQASTATITLGGATTQQQHPSAPAQQDGNRRRRRQNVPKHMLVDQPSQPASQPARTRPVNQPRTRPGSANPGGGVTVMGGGGMSFGIDYTAKPGTAISSTPDQMYQQQTLFDSRPQPVPAKPAQYNPGPHENIDDERAAQAREKIKQMGIPAEQVEIYRKRFNVLDLNKDGVVNLREFAAISRVLGYKFTKMEILEIFGRKDLDDSGGISFDEFVLAMYERSQKSKELAPYRQLFRLYDIQGRGYITTDEAFPVLRRELGFDENKTEMLFDMFDNNRDYRLSLLEFIKFYKRVEELKAQVQNAFRDFDRNGDGFVDKTEIKNVLGPKGFSDQQVDALMYKYDIDCDGMLNYQEFAAFWDVQFV